jgi:hypothetical protein
MKSKKPARPFPSVATEIPDYGIKYAVTSVAEARGLSESLTAACINAQPTDAILYRFNCGGNPYFSYVATFESSIEGWKAARLFNESNERTTIKKPQEYIDQIKRYSHTVIAEDICSSNQRRIYFFLGDHKYVINILPPSDDKPRGYMGGGVTALEPLPGEQCTRGNDIHDGPYGEETWYKIMEDIVSYELASRQIAANKQASEVCPETSVKPLDTYDNFVHKLRSLSGRVLTVIDASIEGPKNAPIKTLIRKEFREQMSREWRSLVQGSQESTSEPIDNEL